MGKPSHGFAGIGKNVRTRSAWVHLLAHVQNDLDGRKVHAEIRASRENDFQTLEIGVGVKRVLPSERRRLQKSSRSYRRSVCGCSSNCSATALIRECLGSPFHLRHDGHQRSAEAQESQDIHDQRRGGQFELHPPTLRLYEREGLLKLRAPRATLGLHRHAILERFGNHSLFDARSRVNLAGVEIILNMAREDGRHAERVRTFFPIPANPCEEFSHIYRARRRSGRAGAY